MPFPRFLLPLVLASLTAGGPSATQTAAAGITGPVVLEQWQPGALEQWRLTGGAGSNPVLSASIVPSPSGIGNALRTTAVRGAGDCRPVAVTRTFTADKVQAYDAYIETFVTFRTSDEDTQPVLMRLELFDESGVALGRRDYYGGGLIPSRLRNRGTATELPVAAGVVRIPLHHVVFRYVPFSRMTVSFVHEGCGGTSEILVGTMVFCPDAKRCGLTVDEGPADGAAEFERMLHLLDEDPLSPYLRSTVPALHIIPAEGRPAGAPLFMPVAMSPAPQVPACADTIEAYIQDARRVHTVVGRRPEVGEKMTAVASAMLGALKLPAGSGADSARAITERVLDNYEMASALGEHLRDEEFGHASAALTKLVLKNLLTRLDGPAHFGKLSRSGHLWLQSYLRSLPDHQRDMVIDNLRIVLKDQPGYVAALASGAAVDLGTVAGGLSEGEVREAMQAVVLNVATTLSPQFALASASFQAMNELALAAQTYVADDEVNRMYAAWKADPNGDYDLNEKWRYTNQALLQAKAVLTATRPATDARTGRPVVITDAEAEEFLTGQFAAWRQAELANGKQADRFTRAWEAYQKSDPQLCVGRALDRQVWPDGRTIGRTWRRAWDSCYEALERFKKYASLHAQVDRELRSWSRADTACSSPGMLALGAEQLACAYLEGAMAGGPGADHAYYDALGAHIERCGWSTRPIAAIKADRQKRVARDLQSMTPRKLQALLQHIGQEAALGCLCRQMNQVYEPLGRGCNPDVSKGLCLLDGIGCTRAAPPMDVYHLGVCGVDRLVTDQLFRVRLAQGR